MSFCSSCGSSVSGTAKFCGNCGKPTSQGLTKNIDARLTEAHGHGATLSGDIASEISRTIFIAPTSFLNTIESLLSGAGVTPFAIVGAIGGAEDVRQKVLSKIKLAPRGVARYVCIIGNWDEVPPFKVPAPVPSSPWDPDEFCFSDSMYGCFEQYSQADISSALPDLYVGRIPSISAEVVKNVLFAKLDQQDVKTSFSFAVSAEKWVVATQTVVDQFMGQSDSVGLKGSPNSEAIADPSLLLCPQWHEAALKGAITAGNIKSNGVLLFNVHGGADEPHWVGESRNGDSCPKIFDQNTIVDFNSSLIVTEACYGGALGYSTGSIAESFFESNGLSYVGSSTIAYGEPASDEIFAADIIALHYLQQLSKGLSAGESLNHAKQEVLMQMDPVSQFETKKTILSFNLFGAPWYRRRRSSSVASIEPSVTRNTSIVDEIRNRSAIINSGNNDILQEIRSRYRASLSSSNKQYFLDSQEARDKLRRFTDSSKINDLLIDWTGDADNYTLQYLSNGDNDGYSLYSDASEAGGSKNILVLYLDAVGKLKRVLTSKGML